MPSAVLVGKEETFRSLGIYNDQKIQLEGLIQKLRNQLEKEIYDTENLEAEVLEGLKAVRDGQVDQRHWREVLNEI